MTWSLFSDGHREPLPVDAVLIGGAGAPERSLEPSRFLIEGSVVLVDGDVAIAIRLDRGSVLVRRDLPDELGWAIAPLVDLLASSGYTLLDEDTLLATPVALQVVGIRLSSWDLWGLDLDDGFAALRAAAVGESWNPVLADPGRNERSI